MGISLATGSLVTGVTMNRITPSPMYGDSIPEEPDEDTDVVSAILTFFSILICLVLFPVSWIFCLTVVAEYERTIVFRLGKVQGEAGRSPGRGQPPPEIP